VPRFPDQRKKVWQSFQVAAKMLEICFFDKDNKKRNNQRFVGSAVREAGIRDVRALAAVCTFTLVIMMSDRVSKYLGKKYACPGCQAHLRFRRPPKKSLLTCPNCRRKLKLQEQAAHANRDELFQEAIESLVTWKPAVVKPYNYILDPLLDRVDSSVPGVWKFDQPWPEHVLQIAIERAEVLFYATDIQGTVRSRQQLLDGSFRRVTVERTGEVEEMEVTGHWYDVEPHSTNLGLLSRQTVRQLNRIVTAKKFAARINCVQQAIQDDRNVLELFVDLAVQEPPHQKPRKFVRIR
jgi:hypothetical protein